MRTSQSVVLGIWIAALHFAAQIASASEVSTSCISGTVKVTAALASELKPGATLFVYAREVDRAQGAPTVVISVTEPRYPQEFTLCPADQMIPGSTAKPLAGRYRVYARHSPTGTPMVEEGFLGSSAGDKSAGIHAGEQVDILIKQPIGKAK